MKHIMCERPRRVGSQPARAKKNGFLAGLPLGGEELA
jgi:hypothetical protein